MNQLQQAFKKAGYKGHYPASFRGKLDSNGNSSTGRNIDSTGRDKEYLHGVYAASNTDKDTWRSRANSKPLTITRGPAKKIH